MINLLSEAAEAAQINWTQVIVQTLATVGLIVGGGFWQYRQTKLQAKLQAKKDEESKKENIELLNKQFGSLNDKVDDMAGDITNIKSDIVLLQKANKATEEYRELRDKQDKIYSEERAAVLKALKGTMRSRLLDFFEKCIEKGYYTVEERDVYHPLYECYKSEPFGGNGVIDDLHNQIVNLPTTKEEARRLSAAPTISKAAKNARNRKTAHS